MHIQSINRVSAGSCNNIETNQKATTYPLHRFEAIYLEKYKWDSRKTETASQEISRILDRIKPVLSDETWKAWHLSMQLHLTLHVIPSSCEVASPFCRAYAAGGIKELTLLGT